MKKIFFCLILFFFLQANLFSQINSYDRYWYFGLNAWDWSSGSPSAIAGCALNNIEGCNTVNDVSGNLLFYGGDDKIYNKNNVLMPNSTGILANVTPKQGPIAVKDPNANSKYYYLYPKGFGGPLYYSFVDMALQAGLGDVQVANKNTQLRAAIAEGIIAIPVTNSCNEVWVITHNIGSSFYIEKITPTGISNFSTIAIGPACTALGGYLAYAPTNGKLALLYGNFNVALFDFNAATGAITNYVNVPLPPIPFTTEYYSIAFSPDGTKLYAGGGYGQNYLMQIDLSNSNTVTSIATANGGNTIRLGPDGKIYGQILYTSNVGVINNPNNAGVACNYVPNVINTGHTTFSDVGFPAMVVVAGGAAAAIANFTTIKDTICVNESIVFTNASANASSYLWNLGNGNTSTLLNPSATYNTAGIFTITLIAQNGCINDTISKSIVVMPAVTVTQNVSICQGSNYTLPNGGIVNSSGTYYDTISLSAKCDSVIITNLSVVNSLTSTQSPVICSGQSFTLPDASTISIAGTYTDTLQTTSGCDSIVTTNLTVTPASTFSQNKNKW